MCTQCGYLRTSQTTPSENLCRPFVRTNLYLSQSLGVFLLQNVFRDPSDPLISSSDGSPYDTGPSSPRNLVYPYPFGRRWVSLTSHEGTRDPTLHTKIPRFTGSVKIENTPRFTFTTLGSRSLSIVSLCVFILYRV